MKWFDRVYIRATIDESINPNSSVVNDFVAAASEIYRVLANRAAIFHYWYIAEPRPRQSTGCSSIRDAISGIRIRGAPFSPCPTLITKVFKVAPDPEFCQRASIRQNGRSFFLLFFFSLYPHREICSSPKWILSPCFRSFSIVHF